MFTVIVTLEIKPDCVNEFVEVITENARRSVADEPGCLGFDVAVSTEAANRFFFYESYLSEDAFRNDHRHAPHYAEFIARSTPLIVPGSKIVQCATHIDTRTEAP